MTPWWRINLYHVPYIFNINTSNRFSSLLIFQTRFPDIFCPVLTTVQFWQPFRVNMAEESLIEGEDENILYDLLVITEWPPETDTQVINKPTFYSF